MGVDSGRVGYLLKDRVANVGEFTDAITRTAAGGTAVDLEVVGGLLNASRHVSALRTLTAREHAVSWFGLGARLFAAYSAAYRHVLLVRVPFAEQVEQA